MGKAKKGNSEESRYGTSVLLLIILAAVALPCYLWQVKFTSDAEDVEGVAHARERAPPRAQASEAAPIESTTPQKQVIEHSAATDPVTDVLRRIQNADFQGNESVMTGRYLKVFQDVHKPVLLETTDLDQIRLLSRGDGWMFLEAPFTPEEERYGNSFPWDASGPDTSVKLRMVMVEHDGNWKLEDVKVVTRP